MKEDFGITKPLFPLAAVLWIGGFGLVRAGGLGFTVIGAAALGGGVLLIVGAILIDLAIEALTDVIREAKGEAQADQSDESAKGEG